MTALINRIINYSGVDGPGIRTVLVFQGCNFNCRYCHWPDTLGTCNGCGICALGCPTGALRHEAPGKTPDFFEEYCTGCGSCINACRKDASPKIRRMSIKDILDRLKENGKRIRGITCSGGECMLQAEFMETLFPIVKEKGYSCLIDTNGSIDFEEQHNLLAVCDGVMLDIKAFDPQKHRELTGWGNETAVKNAVYLARRGKLAEVRTVVTTADYGARETVGAVTRLLRPYLAVQDIRYRLIPFRVYGVRREFRALGTPPQAVMEDLCREALDNGWRTVVVT
ncbi:MAG: YjjW family glycine radical enzyme activase [Treponema sp.]|jgi:pyruvate formate lyase activating enzyme|nr:YjjW family glycine radical enzyme activase [Treponema sp.]